MAVGFSLSRHQVDAFSSFVRAELDDFFKNKQAPVMLADSVLSLDAVTNDLIFWLSKIGPHGMGNPVLHFIFPSIRVMSAKLVGRQHVSCLLCSTQTGKRIRAIAFQSANEPLGQALLAGGLLHIVGHIQKSVWQQKESIQIVIEDAMFIT